MFIRRAPVNPPSQQSFELRAAALAGETPAPMDALAAAEFVRRNTAPSRPPLCPELRLWLATELTPLWTATAEVLANVDPLPFWAFAWPGGQALARYLFDHRSLVTGRTVLDFGAGGAIAAIAAVMAGARRAFASDTDPFCVVAGDLNAELNGVRVETTSDDLLGGDARGAEVVLAGDIFYERPTAERGMAWLRSLAARGVLVLVGDPGRIYSPTQGLERLATYDVPTSRELEDGDSRVTTVSRVLP